MAKQQTNYEYLLEKQQTGELTRLFSLGLSTKYLRFMEIYAYHLTHPKASQLEVSLVFKTCKSVVYEVYQVMERS